MTYASILSYNYALARSNVGDFDAAAASLRSAIALSAQDRYLRTLGLVELARMQAIIQAGAADAAAQEAFQTALTNAIQSTAAAIAKSPTSFDNRFAQSAVYASVIPLGIEGAFERSKAVLEDARKLNPLGPEVDLRLAEIELAHGNGPAARAAIAVALQKKADYTAAILFLAQLELDSGDLGKAIDSVKAAVYFEPRNPTLLYQLGVLLIQDEAYPDAAIAFEEALKVAPDFQNAAFFLAQAYAFLDRIPDAVRVMGELASKNPDNATVRSYWNDLKNGENPFNAVAAPPEEDVSAE